MQATTSETPLVITPVTECADIADIVGLEAAEVCAPTLTWRGRLLIGLAAVVVLVGIATVGTLLMHHERGNAPPAHERTAAVTGSQTPTTILFPLQRPDG